MSWKEPPLRKSYTCNAELVAYLRQKKGWTQRQLADASGYSERLVNKAEAGQSVSASTIADLADTLSSDEEPVFPEDLISDPIAMAKAYIAAEYEHPEDVVGAIRHFLDDDFTIKMNGDPELIPFAGVHRGIAAVQQVYKLFFSLLEPPPNHDWRPWYQFQGQGNEVLAWGKNWTGPIGQPLNEPMDLVHRFTFRRGKLLQNEVIHDTLRAVHLLNDDAYPTNGEAANHDVNGVDASVRPSPDVRRPKP